MDQHCAWQTSDTVNKLFGITTADSNKRELKLLPGDVRKTSAAGWELSSIDFSGLRVAETEIGAASGATALLQIAGTDAAIVHNLGKGWTIYLNTTWDQYPKQRTTNFGGAAYRELTRAILNKAGVRPAIQVSSPDGHPVSQVQVARYKFGAAEVIAIVKESVALKGVVGQDGVTTYNDAKLGEIAQQELTIKLPYKAHVADVRSGKRFGYTDIVHTSILFGDAIVLGLSRAENQITIQGATSAQRGDHISLSLISTSNDVGLTRCHVLGPNGSQLSMYSNNVLLRNGRGNFILPFALNDEPGKYLVKATDVVTGASIGKTIELR
jgi:hypothetical protein